MLTLLTGGVKHGSDGAGTHQEVALVVVLGNGQADVNSKRAFNTTRISQTSLTQDTYDHRNRTHSRQL
jgi:hypothetical protein